MDHGHVFVVRGRLESIDADVVIIPTDADFRVENRWKVVWSGVGNPHPTKPPGWQMGSSAASVDPIEADMPAVWFVDAAVNRGETEDRAMSKIVPGVEEVFDYIKHHSDGGTDNAQGRALANLP